LTEIKIGRSAKLKFRNNWDECLIGLIPTKTDSLIRPKSMLLAKAEGNHVPDLAVAEVNAPVVGLGEKAYRGEKRGARGNAHIASRSFPPQICPFTCVNARRTRATKHVLEDLVGGSAPEAKAANRFLEDLVVGSVLVDREVSAPVAVLVGKVEG